VLLRHGETDWNLTGRAQGHADVPLNATGHAQAAAVASYLVAMRPVRLWSSDLVRAIETAEHVAAATGLAIETDPRLREYDVGERSGLTLAEAAARFPQEYASYRAGTSPTLVPGEETTEQVHDRVVPALRACLDALEVGETGVVVMHGACLRVGVMGLVGWPWQQARALVAIDNAAYCVLVDDGPSGRGVRLASYNVSAGDPRPQTSSPISSANASR
jgi:probable phosphoglycerate mutase